LIKFIKKEEWFMKVIEKRFKKEKVIIGMVHIQALPGTPRHSKSMKEIISKAVEEAKLFENAGFDAVLLENMHDIPYLNRNVGPEIVASMTAIACEIKNNISLPVGVQILSGANKQALAVAKAANLDFIRAEGFVFSHISDEGLMNSDAGELLRYRQQIDAQNILIFTDIQKKHSSHHLTSDISITEFAKAAEFFLSDGIVLTGTVTGRPADTIELKAVKKEINLPVLIGSGISEKNISSYWNFADGFIVGSYFKDKGYWENPISKERVTKFMKNINSLRKKDIT